MFKIEAGPCPALQWDEDGSSACGLMREPARYAPVRARIKGVGALSHAMKLAQGAGQGCTMPGPGECHDRAWRKSLKGTPKEMWKARKLWGLPTDATPSLLDRDRLLRLFGHIDRQITAPAMFVHHR
jgi:hypothetical protein